MNQTSYAPGADSGLTATLKTIWGHVLNIPPEKLDGASSFLGLGGDSLAAMQVVSECFESGIATTVQDVLGNDNFSQLVAKAKPTKASSRAPSNFDDDASQPFALAPMQQQHFKLASHGDNRFLQAFLLSLKRKVEFNELSRAVSTLVQRHAMLRSRFLQNEQGIWLQYCIPAAAESSNVLFHDIQSPVDLVDLVHQSQLRINTRNGPVFLVESIQRAADGQYLLLVGHQLAIDLVSWRIILHDLEEILRTGKPPKHQSVPFSIWCKLQAARAATPDLAPRKIGGSPIPPADFYYWGIEESIGTYGSSIERKIHLSLETTLVLLGDLPRSWKAELIDVLLAAIVLSFDCTFPDRLPPAIFNESHGREPWSDDLDISRTVGWFTTIFPLVVEISADDTLPDVVRRMYQQRKKPSDNGWAYWTSRFLNPQGRRAFRHHEEMEIVFNYEGVYQHLERADSLFSHGPHVPAALLDDALSLSLSKSKSKTRSATVKNISVFEITIAIVDGRLEISFLHPRTILHQDRITEWVQKFHATLEQATKFVADSRSLNIRRNAVSGIEKIIPCSPMQYGILLGQEKHPGTYILTYLWKIHPRSGEPLLLEKLRLAWQAVVDKHAALRTIFVQENGDVATRQSVLLRLEAFITEETITSLDVIDAASAEPKFLMISASTPAHHMHLYSTKTGQHYLRLEISHAIFDGESSVLLADEIARAYDTPLAQPLATYADFVAYLEGLSTEHLEYWKQYLLSANPCHFPVLKDGKNDSNERLHKLYTIDLDISLQELVAFCAQSRTTLFNVFLGAWALVLKIYTGSDEVCFGYLASGRDIALDGVQDIIGPFINMLVCYISTDSSMSVADLGQKIRADLLRSLAHQHTPLVKMHQAIGLTDRPLFNSILMFQRSDNTALDTSIQLAKIGGQSKTEYDLTLNIDVSQDRIAVVFKYWTSRLSDAQAQNVAHAFSSAVSTFVHHYNSKLADLDLLGDHSLAQIKIWNNHQPRTVEATIHEQIQHHAMAAPEAPALYSKDLKLTFGELDEAAEKLAVRLQTLGVGPEVIVPFCFPKSGWTIVACLAIMKAGGACVALDPSYPPDRLRGIIEDTGASLAISSADQSHILEGMVPSVIVLDHNYLAGLPAHGVDAQLESNASPSNLAFVVFTSGSTGAPKGILLEHRNLCTSAQAHSAVMRLHERSRVLQFAAYTFDVSNQDIWTTLIKGGCVCVPTDTDRLNVQKLAEFVKDAQVNWTFLTPTVANLLTPAHVPTLKTLTLGGEAITHENTRIWKDVRLLNSYGPAEASICCAVSEIRHGEDPSNFGRALDSAILWITDPSDTNILAPIGAIGMLLIEGPILARGYLNDEVKTNKSFITNPRWLQRFNDSSRERRFYITGDLVKYNSDGSMSFVGRADSQIKHHGQRIELGDIESHLASHPTFKQSLILYSKSGRFEKRITAVIAPSESNQSSGATDVQLLPEDDRSRGIISAARSWLTQKIPSYMVPSVWIVVNRIPLTPSGKMNKKLLTRWVEDLDGESQGRILRALDKAVKDKVISPTETIIRSVWAKVLNIAPHNVSVELSFFQLGGDSISAIQAASRLRRENFKVAMGDILQQKTIRNLASYVDAADVVENSSFKHVYQESEASFPLAPMQQMYFDADPDGEHVYTQNHLLKLSKRFDSSRIHEALGAVTALHPILRTRFSNEDGEWTQHIASIDDDAFYFEHGKVSANATVEQYIFSVLAKLSISTGPLLAVVLLDQDNGQLLYITAHHLVIDHVSWRIIFEQLEDYLTHGSLVEEQSTSFQSWVLRAQVFSEDHLQPDEVLPFSVPPADLDYWGLRGVPNTHGSAIKVSFMLEEDITSQLLVQCHSALRTEPLEVMIAALSYSFHSTFPDRQLPAVFNEGHGRDFLDDLVDTSRTVGWFTTVVPIAVSPHEHILDVVRDVKDTRRSIPGKGSPYFWSRYITAEGTAAFGDHFPAEVVFNYLGHYQQLESPDLIFQRASGVDIPTTHTNLERFSIFEIIAAVIDNRLKFTLTWSKHSQKQEEITSWIRAFQQVLPEVVQSLTTADPDLTVADVPLLSISGEDLTNFTHNVLPNGTALGVNDVTEIYPCSPTQEGLLLAQLRNSDVYWYSTIIDISDDGGNGNLNASAISHAWNQLVEHNEILRTVFFQDISHDGAFSQVLLKRPKADILHISGSSAELFAKLSTPSTLKFDQGHLLHRFTIGSSTNQRLYRCKLEIHHAISDGASTDIIIAGLKQLLASSPLRSSPLRYRDYVAYTKQQSNSASIQYWKNLLRGVEPSILLSRTKIPIEQRRKIGSTRVELREPILSLRTFCSNHGITLSTLVQTAWALTLKTYNNSPDSVFGYLNSGREAPLPGIENTIGPFINTLPCVLRWDGLRTIEEALQEAQQGIAQSLPHQHCALSEIYHALGLQNNRVFNTVVSFQRRTEGSAHDNAIGIKLYRHRANDPTEFDLAVDIEDCGNHIDVMLEYWNDKIPGETAFLIADTLSQAITSIIRDPLSNVNSIKLLGPESQRLLESYSSMNTLQTPFNTHVIHKVIKEITKTYFNKTAVVSKDGELTYKELDRLSTRTSRHLVSLGVGRGSRIPFMFEKSTSAIIGILAILKSGAACVPLDPRAPSSRLDKVFSDVGADVALCSPLYLDALKERVSRVISLDRSAIEALPDVDDDETTVPSEPSDTAWIIFTSGTTGNPKGTILEHGSLCATAQIQTSAVHMDSSCRVLHFASYTFDVSIEEVCFTLMHGATICVVSDEDRLNHLAGAMRQLEVTWADLTPTVASMITPSDVPSLLTLVTGGELLKESIISQWADRAHLFNTYGPSEASIYITATKTLTRVSDPANIGFPIGCKLWVVNPEDIHTLCPVGAIGELLVEGKKVAQGYLNNTELTRHAFIQFPAWHPQANSVTRSCLYRTGDLVRYNFDGSLNIIGRKDNQNKINGQRLELGEIEQQIKAAAPSLKNVAVEVIEVQVLDSRRMLIAFLESAEPGVDELILDISASAARHLPPYMIPSVYVPVHTLPLTTSGKIDRRALRELAASLPVEDLITRAKSVRTPSTDEEFRLQNLWAQVLGRPATSISIDDNFFQLGGDSVLAINLASTARKSGLQLNVAQIFRHPSLKEMAECFVNAKQMTTHETANFNLRRPFTLLKAATSRDLVLKALSTSLKSVDVNNIVDIYPTVPLQEGLFALSLQNPTAYVLRQVFRLPKEFDVQRFQKAWEYVAEKTDILRTRIGHTVQYGAYQIVVNEPIQWRTASSLDQYLAMDLNKPFHSGEPLSRYAIVEDGDSTYFAWSIHHAAFDGWSYNLIVKAVCNVFNGRALHHFTPFASFVGYLNEIEQLESDAFWNEYLQGCRALHFPELPSSSYKLCCDSVRSHRFDMTSGSTSELTLPTILKTAWALLQSKYNGSNDVVYGITNIGRDVPMAGIEHVAGPTIATAPFRVQIDRRQKMADLLRKVQHGTTDLIAHQHAGLQHIRSLGGHARNACSFQTMLVIQPGDELSAMESDLKLERIATKSPNSNNYAVTLECFPCGTTVELVLSFDDAVVPTLQAESLLRHFETLVHQLLDSGDNTAEDTNILSPLDLAEIARWSKTNAVGEIALVGDILEELGVTDIDSTPNEPWIVDPSNFDKLSPLYGRGELVVQVHSHAASKLAGHADQLLVRPLWADSFDVQQDYKFLKTGKLAKIDHVGRLRLLEAKEPHDEARDRQSGLEVVEEKLRHTLPAHIKFVVACINARSQLPRSIALFYYTDLAQHVKGTRTAITLLSPSETERPLFLYARNYLVGSLSHELIPAAFFPVSHFSYDTSGEVDIKQLLGLVSVLPQEQLNGYSLEQQRKKQQFTDPRYKLLQFLWADTLELPAHDVGGDDTFLGLGGDSLSAIKLVTAAAEQGFEITVPDLFGGMTFGEMARTVGQSQHLKESTMTEPQKPKPFSLVGDAKAQLLDTLTMNFNVEPHHVQDLYPCTPLQEGLFSLSQQQQGAYVDRQVYRVPDHVSTEKFKRAWREVVRNVDILRTVIVSATFSTLYQAVLLEDRSVVWASGKNLLEYLSSDKKSLMGVGLPLVRFAIIEQVDNIRYFVLTIHHALYDGWTRNILWRLFESAYSVGICPTVPQFSLFVESILSRSSSENNAFWRRSLEGATPSTFPKPSYTDQRSRDIGVFTHAAELKPNKNSQQLGITLATKLRGAWAILMSQYEVSTRLDVVFGITQSGRDSQVQNIAGIAGPTIATYPLRVKWSRGMTIRQFLVQLQQNLLDGLPYEHAGIHHIQALSDDCRNACGFQNLLVIQPANQGDHSGLLGASEQAFNSSWADFSTYPLTMECHLGDNTVDFRAIYDKKAVDMIQIDRLLHQYESILIQLHESDSQLETGDIASFSPFDADQFAAFYPRYPEASPDSVTGLFKRSTIETPFRQAVFSLHSRSFTYQELDVATDTLAKHLTFLGIDKGTLVPLCFQKTSWAVVAALSVIKAGGAFVFLDPEHPPARRSQFLSRIHVKLILASPEQMHLFSNPVSHYKLVRVEEELIRNLPPKIIPLPKSEPDDTLFAMFTSGSTGSPKCCMLSHGSFLSSASDYRKTFKLQRESRVFQFASYVFDLSIMEMLATLTVGACVCIPSDEERATDVGQTMNKLKVSWSFLTPTVARTISPRDVSTLHTLVLGGEALSRLDVSTWADHVHLCNGYGPTECSIFVIGSAGLHRDSNAAEIGRMFNAVGWVVNPDNHHQLAPLGAPGELLIEGPVVSLGYLGDHQRTDEVYITDPQWRYRLGPHPPAGQKARFYKTGDLVRYNSSGAIAYIGRKDTQIKIRGQRIEIGEIENRLSANELVESVVVIFPKEGRVREQLTAVLVLNHTIPWQAGDLISALPTHDHTTVSANLNNLARSLRRELPPAMVPSVWIPIKIIPRLPSGKSDRRRLTTWIESLDEESHAALIDLKGGTSTKSRPLNDIELQLQSIWAKVLHRPVNTIGSESCFIDLGGNSISAMHVGSLARASRISLPIRAMVASETLADLALQAKLLTNMEITTAVEQPNTPFGLSPIQQLYADLAFGQDEVSRSTNQRFNYSFCFRLRESISVEQLSRAFEAVTKEHAMLRARFRFDNETGIPYQLITGDIYASYQITVHDYANVEDARKVIEQSRTSLDVWNGPLASVDLVNTSSDQILFIAIHHLVVDMVSWNTILEGIEEHLATGQLVASTGSSFWQWCEIQKEHAANLDPKTSLPHPIPSPNFSFWGLDSGNNLLDELVVEHWNTPPMLCGKAEVQDMVLAALATSFCKIFPDREPISTFCWHHGRETLVPTLDISRTVGWFSTIFPVHIVPAVQDSTTDLIAKARCARENLPRHGWEYFASRYLTPNGAATFKGHEKMELLFNFLGSGLPRRTRTHSLLEHFHGFKDSADGGLGGAGQVVKRLSLFSVEATVKEDGVLSCSFGWNKKARHQERIAKWLELFKASLQDMVAEL